MRSTNTTRPFAVYVLMALLVLLGANALYGGYSLMTDPTGGAMGMPLSLLAGSPFQTYLVPGLILFFALGVAPFLVLLALWFKPDWPFMAGLERLVHEHWGWTAALAVGVALVIWILVQMSILRFFLQPILLALGVLIISVGLLPAVRRFYATPEGEV